LVVVVVVLLLSAPGLLHTVGWQRGKIEEICGGRHAAPAGDVDRGGWRCDDGAINSGVA